MSLFLFSTVVRMSQFETFVAEASTAERLTQIKQAVSHYTADHPLREGTDGFRKLHALINKRGRELNFACYTWGVATWHPSPTPGWTDSTQPWPAPPSGKLTTPF